MTAASLGEPVILLQWRCDGPSQRLNTKMVTGAGGTRGKAALTHRGIEALRPTVGAYRIPDLRCPGLAVRVAPSGLKTWDVAFRVRGTGTVRRLSLGPFPAISLETARERTTALTNAAKAGRDLLAEEKAAKAAAEARTTVAQLIELYLGRMVRGKLRTANEIELRIKRALALLKDRCADEIRRHDLRKILDAVAERGVLREAEKQRQLMRSLFGWALSQDIIGLDPTAGLSSYGSSPRRDRILSSEEIKLLWDWLEKCGMPLDYVGALKLQLSTGARIGESGGICAPEVDQGTWLWTLPAARSKNGRARVTPLVGFAREIVENRLKIINQGPLFTTEQGDPLTSNCVASLIVKRRREIPIEHFTSHDLRRTVATSLVDLGFSFDVVATVLGHETGSKNVRTLIRHYVRSDQVDRKRIALEAWDSRLRQILRGETPPANVTHLAIRRERNVA
jgi:integrase